MQNKVELPESLINKLIELPEQGMGYQLVKIVMQNGVILKNRIVLNSTFLLLEENEKINIEEIEDIEIEE